MKSRLLFVLLLFVALFILLSRSNHAVQDFILDLISPVKQGYKKLTHSVEDRGKSYLFQKENIQRLTKENKTLRKYLLDQTHYLEQVSSLFKTLPSLEKLPHRSIELVDTVSYVRLNSFNEVLLARSNKARLREGRVYGLIQNDVVGGTAVLRGQHLYGYLTSNPRCRFGVFVGPKRAPGIAEGVDKETMAVKFIPKWYKIKPGDKVETSGLDGIFFANVPVGIVKEVKIEDSFKTVYITSYSDSLHPSYFFLITDPRPYLISTYDRNTSQLGNEAAQTAAVPLDRNQTISSIPQTVQTQENEVDPSVFEIPKEPTTPKPPVVLRHPKKKAKKTKHASQNKKKSPPPNAQKNSRTSAPALKPKPEAKGSAPKAKRKRKSAMDILNGL